jgi:hypothetical protein
LHEPETLSDLCSLPDIGSRVGSGQVAAKEVLMASVRGIMGCVIRLLPVALGIGLLAVGSQAAADPYFNSRESGCGGSDPNVLTCDDFETNGSGGTPGTWYITDGDTSSGMTNPANKGWGGTIYANPITPSGAIMCGAGVTPFGNCAATAGTKSGGRTDRNMALRHLKTETCGSDGSQLCDVSEIYVRWYAKWLAPYSFGGEKHMNITNSDGDIAFANVQLNCGAGGSSPTAIPSIQVLHGGPQFANCPGPNVGPGISIQADRWYFFEMHVRTGSNGLIRLWINDCGSTGTSCGASPILRTQLGPGNLPGNANGSKIQTIWLESWANPASSGTGPLWDQLKVSRVGPIGFAGGGSIGGGSSVADGTPPAVPGALTIR